jgi:protein-tyrosine phosphatase
MKLVETSKGNLYIGSKDDALTITEGKDSYDVIWNLAAELEFLAELEEKNAKKVMCAGITDYDIPTSKRAFIAQLNQVVTTLKDGGTVFIHCFGGHGRTGLALAAIKKCLDKMSGKDAIAFATKECDGPESDAQVEFVLSL